MYQSTLTIRDLAQIVIRIDNYYVEDLFNLVPNELLDTVFDAENTEMISKQLDALRFEKEKDFLVSLDPDEDLEVILNSPHNTFVGEKEQKKKEILFLFYLNLLLTHW